MSAQEFGVLLRQHRRAAGLTQLELAARAALSARAISNMERGRTERPYPRSLRLLAAALGLPDEDRDHLLRTLRAGAPQGAAGPVAGTASAAAGGTVAAPRQLPSDVRYFTGRDDEMAILSAMRERGDGNAPVICAITGMGGIGKTALAVHWAHQVAESFADGQMYIDLRGFDPSAEPLEPTVALRALLDGLGVPADRLPPAVEAEVGLYRSLLARKRLLIVLDNARDEQQVRLLLPGGGMVLVTSRSRLAGLAAVDGTSGLNLNVLPLTQARHLLRDRVGTLRASTEPGAVTDLARMCAGLPLALNTVAARAAARPGLSLEAFAAELRGGRHRLDALAIGDASGDLRAVFSWSYRACSEPAAQAFRLLGMHPGPSISVSAAASLVGVQVRQARRLLGELADTGLVAEDADGRFMVHELLRAYTVELEQGYQADDLRASARRRMLDHYLHSAEQADHLLYGDQRRAAVPPLQPGVVPERFAGQREALAWFLAEHRVLVEVARDAAAAGTDDIRTGLLVQAVTRFLRAQGRWQAVIELQDTVLEAIWRGEPGQQARAHHAAGNGTDLPGTYWQMHRVLAHALQLLDQLGGEVTAVRGGPARPSPGATGEMAPPRSSDGGTAGDILSSGGLSVDLRRHLVTVNDQEVHLTFKEFGILAMLAAEPGRVFTRELIMARVWGHDGAGDMRTLRVHISLLRKKLNAPNLIQTVHGVGFRLAAQDLSELAPRLHRLPEQGRQAAEMKPLIRHGCRVRYGRRAGKVAFIIPPGGRPLICAGHFRRVPRRRCSSSSPDGNPGDHWHRPHWAGDGRRRGCRGLPVGAGHAPG